MKPEEKISYLFLFLAGGIIASLIRDFAPMWLKTVICFAALGVAIFLEVKRESKP